MNENHEGQAPVVPGEDGNAATAISGGEAPAAVDVGRSSPGQVSDGEKVPGSMGPGDLDQAREYGRLVGVVVALQLRVGIMRREIASAMGIPPEEMHLAGALFMAIKADKANESNPAAIGAAKFIKLLVDTETPIE